MVFCLFLSFLLPHFIFDLYIKDNLIYSKCLIITCRSKRVLFCPNSVCLFVSLFFLQVESKRCPDTHQKSHRSMGAAQRVWHCCQLCRHWSPPACGGPAAVPYQRPSAQGSCSLGEKLHPGWGWLNLHLPRDRQRNSWGNQGKGELASLPWPWHYQRHLWQMLLPWAFAATSSGYQGEGGPEAIQIICETAERGSEPGRSQAAGGPQLWAWVRWLFSAQRHSWGGRSPGGRMHCFSAGFLIQGQALNPWTSFSFYDRLMQHLLLEPLDFYFIAGEKEAKTTRAFAGTWWYLTWLPVATLEKWVGPSQH